MSLTIISPSHKTLAENLGRKNYILERASIDELFIDVTKFCYQSETENGNDADSKATDGKATNNDDDDDTNSDKATTRFRTCCDKDSIQSLKETVICHESSLDARDMKDEIGKALRLGCHIAFIARKAVLEKLGFTLSAGISTNKLVSKLGATYGKPNGQVSSNVTICFQTHSHFILTLLLHNIF